MGLDAVEIVLRAEELFDISVGDKEAGQVRTAGDFYQLICHKLDLEPLSVPHTSSDLPTITQKRKASLFGYRHKPLPAPAEVLPWSPQSVWDCVIAIFVDQMGLTPEEVRYDATINRDLGID